MPRVSVIMPAYNSMDTIGKALGSVQRQTFPDLEIVVVDDQSTDGTYEFLQQAEQQDPRIKLFRLPHNSGSSPARSVALQKAIGDWITLCDTDDWYEPERVARLIETAAAANADMVIDNLQIFDHAANKIVEQTNFGRSQKITELRIEDFFGLDNPLRRDSIGYSKPLVRASFLRDRRIDYWEKYRNNEDFIILAEIVILGAKTVIIPDALYIYQHRISPTTRKVSPTSHSANNTAIFVAHACDDLLEKHRDKLPAMAQRKLIRRKNIFLMSNIAGLQKSYFLHGNYLKALALFKNPSLWSYRIIGLRNRLARSLHRARNPGRAVISPDYATASPRVSILMPAYNVEQTIRRALASLQVQTFSNIEIILVDDQSSDGTYQIAKELAAQDPRIKVFQTPENLGSGGAGKLAMQHATGDWATLLDADDWCEPNRIEMLLKAATGLNADAILDNLQIFDHSQGRIVNNTNYGSARTITALKAENVFRKDNPLRRHSIGYSKPMMRTSFLRDHKINYWGKYRNNEDFILLSELILAGAKAFVIPEAYYVYVQRISPSTRAISPHSRSECDTSLLIAQSCDELMEKYPSGFTEKARRELLRRKKIFLTASIAEMQIRLLNQGQFVRAISLFIKYPALWGYRGAGLRNRVYQTLRPAAWNVRPRQPSSRPSTTFL